MIQANWLRLLLRTCHNTRVPLPIVQLESDPAFGQVRNIGRIRKLGDNDPDEANRIIKERILNKDSVGFDLKHQNGFKLFDIEEKFEIDQNKLQREMRKLQTLFHPDKYVGRNPRTQATSIELSSMVNDFYRLLSHPYERGKYLLSLKTNTNPDELEKKLSAIKLDGEFLARMMDISEKAQCPTSDIMTLKRLSADLDQDLAQLTNKLKEDFEAKRYDNIYKDLGKLKFVANCHISIVNRLGSFDNF